MSRLATALVHRALEGDKGALRLLARRLLPLIHARVRLRLLQRGEPVHDTQAIDDLVLASWLDLLAERGRGLRAYDPASGESLERHAIRLAVEALERLRPARAAAPAPEAAAPDPAAEAFFAALAPEGCLVIRYVFTDGVRPDRVAEILDLSRARVDHWIEVARAQARRAQGLETTGESP